MSGNNDILQATGNKYMCVQYVYALNIFWTESKYTIMTFLFVS